MSFDESYSRRMGVMTGFGSYIKAVIDDQGIEKALEYSRKATHIQCDVMMKDYVSSDMHLTPQEARDRLRKGNPRSGINGTVEVVDNEVISSNEKCVFYDGWSAAGLKPSEIEQICRVRFEVFSERIWKKRNPNIEGELRKFKESPEGICLEVLKFKE